MKTLTATKARRSLSTILSQAIQGEDIGIIHSKSGRIVALRPVEVYSDDYALVEYGSTAGELKHSEQNILGNLKREKAKQWDGTVKGLRN